jgi:hypothetical protein
MPERGRTAEAWFIELWIAACLAVFFVLRVLQSRLVQHLLAGLRHS